MIAKYKQLIKNTLLHREKTWCIAVSNFTGENNWSLFFDVDNDDQIALEKGIDIIRQTLKCEPIIAYTKHGIQFLTFPLFSLNQVYHCFSKLKMNIKTDYFWSVPLWLRISPKYNVKGEIISPSPVPYSGHYTQYQYLIRNLPHKKLYQTWD